MELWISSLSSNRHGGKQYQLYGYNPYHIVIQLAVNSLVGKVKHYIYISSDSIYMVCKKPKDIDRCRREEDAIRPEVLSIWMILRFYWLILWRLQEDRELLNSKDRYGDGKLCCEEVLDEAFRKMSFPSTRFLFSCCFPSFFSFFLKLFSLRLPDVYGPFDTSDRHWKYQIWMKVSDVFPVELTPAGENVGVCKFNNFHVYVQNKLSFVYREDVISAVLAI